MTGTARSLTGCADAVVGPQIHLLVLHTPPQPFHEHVVSPAASDAHAGLDAMVFQQPGELLADELAALVGVEDVRCAIAGQGLLARFNAEVSRQRVRQPPRQHSADAAGAGAWLRTKNKSAADSLLEAFEELLTVDRLKVPARMRKTLT